jgi:hypothetical protein
MSAVKQIIAATGIATALMATQYALLTRKPRPSDDMAPVFHVGFVSDISEMVGIMNAADAVPAVCIHRSQHKL